MSSSVLRPDLTGCTTGVTIFVILGDLARTASSLSRPPTPPSAPSASRPRASSSVLGGRWRRSGAGRGIGELLWGLWKLPIAKDLDLAKPLRYSLRVPSAVNRRRRGDARTSAGPETLRRRASDAGNRTESAARLEYLPQACADVRTLQRDDQCRRAVPVVEPGPQGAPRGHGRRL